MFTPQSPHTSLAWKVIERYTKGQDIDELKQQVPQQELAMALACFVTLHKKDGSLRGCIGTVEPVHETLHQEIISNAIAAITRDTRFGPLQREELPEIEVSVDVLSKPLPVQDVNKLDPARYGVIVTDGNLRKGLLLPNIEGIDTVEQQLQVAQKKAGLHDLDISKLQVFWFTSTRYY